MDGQSGNRRSQLLIAVLWIDRAPVFCAGGLVPCRAAGVSTAMPHYLVELIGGIAATITTLGYVPQAIKSIRTRDTASISLAMYVMLAVGIALWLVYGILINSWPLIGANAVTLVTILVILAMKIRHG